MAENKTQPTDADVAAYLAAIEDPTRRADCQALAALMSDVTGQPPVLWGTAIVGFGTFDYKPASSKSYRWFPVGFANRKSELTLYLSGGHVRTSPATERLGPHRVGGGCLYLKRLAGVDTTALRELIAAAYADPMGGVER